MLPAGASPVPVRPSIRLGTGTLSSVTAGADGTFTINDVPRTRREVTCTVSWPGDDPHEGSTASAEVYVGR